MSRSQALSLRCAEPEGKSSRVQIQALAVTSGPALCEAPAPQGLLPPSHHIREVGCSISTRDWETSARTVPCSIRDFTCGHRRQDRRRGAAPFRGGGWKHRRRQGGGGWRQTAQFICRLACSPAPRNFQEEEPDADNVRGHRGLVTLVPAQITSGNPFTPALPPLSGRPGHQAGQSLLCAASGPGLRRESGRDGGHLTQARRTPSAGGRTCFTSCRALGSKVWVPDPTCEQFLLQEGSKPL